MCVFPFELSSVLDTTGFLCVCVKTQGGKSLAPLVRLERGRAPQFPKMARDRHAAIISEEAKQVDTVLELETFILKSHL